MPHLKQKKSWKTPCIHWSVILRGQLYSHRSFVLLPLLSSTQLFPSNKYRTAHKQFVIGGNEFLIIETDNVLWHLEQCCSALLRARASPNVIIVATIIYQCQLGWGVSNWWMQRTDPISRPGLLTSFHLVFAGPSLFQHKLWVFNITLLGPASQLVFVYYITIAAMPSLLCRLQILVGWELEQFSDRKSCVTQQVSVTGNARIFMKYH